MTESELLENFLDKLASAEPAPGGGSASAACGAIAASLVCMVCRLTIGKKSYESVWDEMRLLLDNAVALQQELRDLVQIDGEAFVRVLDAYKKPRQTAEEKFARTAAIQSALKQATEIPMRIAECCAQLITVAAPLAVKANKNAMGDLSVGILLAEASARGAIVTMSENLRTIQDENFVRDRRNRAENLLRQSERGRIEILKIASEKT